MNPSFMHFNIAIMQTAFDWNDLRYFLAIAHAGHLAGAARSLGVNHSTVFRRINAMEERLKVRLFDRLPDGYALTAAGADILDQAERIDEDFDALQRKLAGRDFELSGRVRLTTAPNLAAAYLPVILEEFEAEFPEVRIEISVSDSDYDLARREADLALRATTAPPDFLVGRRIASLPWIACASDRYLQQHGEPRGESDLAEHALIGADPGFARLTVFDWLRRSQPSSAIRYTCNDLRTMAALAQQGLGIALLPADMQHCDLKPLFRVCPEATGELWLLTHPDLRRVARIRALMSFLYDRLRADSRLKPFAAQSSPPD
jgi:DNA-binding transcriptional LysR family regulator